MDVNFSWKDKLDNTAQDDSELESVSSQQEQETTSDGDVEDKELPDTTQATA